jgi:dTDP-4-amino-4,6-dideoxygalactose transaminase
MWVRKRIDIGWLDLASAAANCFIPRLRFAARDAVEAAWSSDGRAFACLSVRTGFDLALAALKFPHGSEVLISALTIPDMVRIIEHHGLIPVPIDLHGEDMSPQVELLEQAVTPKTKAILVAHLLGGRFDLTPFVEFARRRELILFEDCAQAFDGTRFRGHDGADVSMFSFGPIKTATALYGGVFRINDDALRNRMRELHAAYPVQSRAAFLRRVLFYCVLHGLGGRIAFAVFLRLLKLLGRNLDQTLNGSIRNFPQAEFFRGLRQQPSYPLLKLLARRITRYRDEELDARVSRGQLLLGLLPPGSCPGGEAKPHSFWLFPVNVSDQASALAELQQAGFDATAGSSLRPVEPPADRLELDPAIARGILSSAIFLPVYSAIPTAEIHRMARVASRFAAVAPIFGNFAIATESAQVPGLTGSD